MLTHSRLLMEDREVCIAKEGFHELRKTRAKDKDDISSKPRTQFKYDKAMQIIKFENPYYASRLFPTIALCASGCNHSKSTKMEKKKNITRSIFNQIESIFHQILGIP